MGDLRKNISTHEITCKCGCGKSDINDKVLDMWQGACDHFSEMLNRPVVLVIKSGCRCQKHNDNTKDAAKKSQHLVGNAIDGKIQGVPHFRLFNYFDSKYPDSCGIKLYNSFVHADCRSGKWRA
jgi:uncharacterized protein YcbK (DUF882 family)